jgi:surface antigen
MAQKAGFKMTAVLSGLLTLGACAEGQSNEAFGTLLGAGLGALIGANIGHGDAGVPLAIVGGALGASIGGSVGARLDEADRMKLELARAHALQYSPSGEATKWYNPDSGNRGAIVPGQAYQDPKGAYCREFTQTVIIAGQEEEAYGRACRQPDGSWLIVSG